MYLEYGPNERKVKIKAELHPYQKKGVAFAVQAGRALIADEMGLGNTIQAIDWSKFGK